jgi:hypothetical protein
MSTPKQVTVDLVVLHAAAAWLSEHDNPEHGHSSLDAAIDPDALARAIDAAEETG